MACTCDVAVLMEAGCQCGQMQRERAAAPADEDEPVLVPPDEPVIVEVQKTNTVPGR